MCFIANFPLCEICENTRVNQNHHWSQSNFHTGKGKQNRHNQKMSAYLADRPEKILFQLTQLVDGGYFLDHLQLESVI